MKPPARPDGVSSAERTALIRQVAEEYLRREAAGEALADDVFLAQHSDLMPELGEELRKYRLITKALQEARSGGETPAREDAITPFQPGGGQRDDPVGLPDIPDYAVVAKVGAGGMGMVCRAWQHRPGRWVALKLMQPGEDLDRFEDEVTVLGR